MTRAWAATSSISTAAGSRQPRALLPTDPTEPTPTASTSFTGWRRTASEQKPAEGIRRPSRGWSFPTAAAIDPGSGLNGRSLAVVAFGRTRKAVNQLEEQDFVGTDQV